MSALLDHQQFDSVRGVCTVTVFQNLLGAFAEATPLHILQLEQRASAGDAEGVRHIAHQIHGFAGNFGCTSLAALGATLEAAGASGDWPAIHAAVARIAATSRETWSAIEDHMGSPCDGGRETPAG